MNLSSARSSTFNPLRIFSKLRTNPNVLFGIIIFTALFAFEMFNYSTTDFALNDLLGDLEFVGFKWATILSIAFCGIDFAGIARLFTPEQGIDEPKEIWFLFGAWLLAATMNAMLTWWGVSMAILTHNVQSAAVMDSKTITDVVPIFVAIMVWVIRILIIGSLSIAGDRLIWQNKGTSRSYRPSNSKNSYRSSNNRNSSRSSRPASISAAPRRTSNRPQMRNENIPTHPEPTYHNVAMGASAKSRAANEKNSNAYRRF